MRQMSEKIKLKPCPFCGNEAEVIKAHSSFLLPYTVVCTTEECGASVGKFRRTREEAVGAWNTRKPIEKIVERLEEESNNDLYSSERQIGFEMAIEIVKQEGCKVDSEKCEWHKVNTNAYRSNTHAELYDSRVMDWDRCPYCNKKVEVVE